MLRKIGRLFTIKTHWEAYMIIYALALGAIERGSVYLTRFPGWGGKLLFLACTSSFSGKRERSQPALGGRFVPAFHATISMMRSGVILLPGSPRAPGSRFCCPVGPTAL